MSFVGDIFNSIVKGRRNFLSFDVREEEERQNSLSVNGEGKRSWKYAKCPSSVTLDETICMRKSGEICMRDSQIINGKSETF